MKKLSKINETLWKSGIERSRIGIERKEDQTHSNIKQLKPIDFAPNSPILFADCDLEVDGSVLLNPDELSRYMDIIDKSEWRLPTGEDLRHIKINYGDDLDFDCSISDEWGELKTSDGQDSFRFELYGKYIVRLDGNRNAFFGPKTLQTKREIPYYKLSMVKNGKILIRLVKDKPMNESLWKSGIERSRTGQERKEDQLPPNNIKDFQEVDLCPDLSFVFADMDLELDGRKNIKPELFLHNLENIEKKGWRLPTCQELSIIHKNKDYYKNNYSTNTIKYNRYGKTPVTIKFENIDDWYLCTRGGDKFVAYKPCSFRLLNMEFHYVGGGLTRIRLVKDRPINEGLWKSGIERSKTGTKRQEDITMLDRLMELPQSKKENVVEMVIQKLYDNLRFLWNNFMRFINKKHFDISYITNKLIGLETVTEIIISKMGTDDFITKTFEFAESMKQKNTKIYEILIDQTYEEVMKLK